MKVRIQYLILFTCLLLVSPLTPSPTYSQSLTSITESDINAMLNGIERAAKKSNVAGMIAPFAPDIKIKLSMLNPGSDTEQQATLTKDQFAFNARKNMRRKLAYNFERKNTRIKIYDDQTAMVTYDLYEAFKFREGTVRSSSSEVLFVGLRDGKLVITALESRIRVY